MEKLFAFLSELKERNIFYKLSQIRPDTIMVEIAVPGERWEIEFFEDGHLEVETFIANPNGMEGEEAIQRLFDNFSDE
jgi:hypothetical protein